MSKKTRFGIDGFNGWPLLPSELKKLQAVLGDEEPRMRPARYGNWGLIDVSRRISTGGGALKLKDAIAMAHRGECNSQRHVIRPFEPTTDYRHLLRPEVVEALEKLKEKTK